MPTSTTTIDPRPPQPPGPPTPTRWGRALLLRLHFYIAVFIGPFLLVAAVSGALYALSPQLEKAIYAEALTGTTVEQPLSLDAQVTAAQAAAGLETVPAAVRPAPEGGTTRVMFTDPALDLVS